MPQEPILITPSILSADLSKLQEEVDSVSEADWLQVDVMDGHFVPNLSFGAPVIKSLKTELPLDIHLMVTNPADRVQEFIDVGAASITFHAEAVEGNDDRKVLIDTIRSKGANVGIAVNPETPVDKVGDMLEYVDLLLIMSVHPGFSGQSFIEHVLSQVQSARSAYPNLMIQMDGGIDDATAKKCIEAGANNLVSGSFIFGAKDRTLAINALRNPS